MKKILVVVLLLIGAIGYSQRIVKNEVDKFTKFTRVETSDVQLKMGFSSRLLFSLRSAGNSYYATFSGYGEGAAIISAKDEMMLLLNNDSTISLKSTGYQSYKIHQSTNSYSHQYSIDKEQIELLAKFEVKSLRKYTAKGYIDTDIPEKNRDRIKETAIVFLKAIN